jgi:hypothetical protein
VGFLQALRTEARMPDFGSQSHCGLRTERLKLRWATQVIATPMITIGPSTV